VDSAALKRLKPGHDNKMATETMAKAIKIVKDRVRFMVPPRIYLFAETVKQRLGLHKFQIINVQECVQ
jgi:hypothetical protein